LTRLARLQSGYTNRRYAILFYSLLFTMIATPAVSALQLKGALIESLLALNLLAAVMPVSAGRNPLLLFTGMVVVSLARPAMLWFRHPTISLISLGIWALLGILAAAAALRFALSAPKVSAEHVYAALSAYLLAGLYFGLLYWILEKIGPGTFTSPGDFSRSSGIYFSFVTLATVGYGDILPRADVARGLAIFEGVGGQLFLAVLVARLLSMYSMPKGN
jgi:voltage-gated potassium channel Kch